jgi:uncharacterized protein (DUF433 family)
VFVIIIGGSAAALAARENWRWTGMSGSVKVHPAAGIIMSPRRDTFSATEAAALGGVAVETVRKEIERKIIRPKRVGHRKRRAIALELCDLYYLRVLSRLDLELPARARTRIHDAIVEHCASHSRRAELVISGLLTLKIRDAQAEVRDRIRRFERWQKKLRERSDVLGGEVTFPNSRLAVRHVGELLERGEEPGVVREDYPYLSDEDLEMARLFVRAYPHVGRPKARQAPAR